LFLGTIEAAALDSRRHPDASRYPQALHSESIRKGVLVASTRAADDIARDRPWVRAMVKPLTGCRMPITEDQLTAIWQQTLPAGLPEAVPDHQDEPRPLPRRGSDWSTLIRHLAGIGVLEYRRDGRIDLPYLYRAGFLLSG